MEYLVTAKNKREARKAFKESGVNKYYDRIQSGFIVEHRIESDPESLEITNVEEA
jgi:hypothetical protein